MYEFNNNYLILDKYRCKK